MPFSDLAEIDDKYRSSRTVEELDQTMMSMTQSLLGFDNIVYLDCLRFLTDREGAEYFSTVSQEWWQRYLDKCYFKDDPVFAAFPFSPSGVRWKDVEGKNGSVGQRIMEESREFGHFNGLTFPLKRPESFFVITLSGRSCAVTDFEMVAAKAAVDLYHIHRLAIMGEPKSGLTKTELKYLYWLSEGKTYVEIAQICGVSEIAVRKRVDSAKTKLNDVTRTGATAKAVGLGLVQPILFNV